MWPNLSVLETLIAFLHQYLGPDLQAAGLVILNLILIESLLSIDNAAVLATLVMGLPENDRRRALRIGLVLAYVFRGACLIFASVLIQIKWLKLVGGGYLFFLGAQYFYNLYFRKEHILEQEQEEIKPQKTRFGFLNLFWSTVLTVETMDLVFSIDNVLAAVAYTSNIYLVMLGVFIGIITMRIVAGYFVVLMEKFPFLDTVAFLVIMLLGLKLMLSFGCESNLAPGFCTYLEGEEADKFFSLTTMGIFVLPILTSLLFNFPQRGQAKR